MVINAKVPGNINVVITRYLDMNAGKDFLKNTKELIFYVNLKRSQIYMREKNARFAKRTLLKSFTNMILRKN